MIERLLETWLNKANERSFQIPFCHWLTATGHTVLHMSRHCAMEVGKDIIAIDPEDTPCAYQLKGVDGGGRMTLSQWREDLSNQLHPLVHRKIVHPSIHTDKPHRSIIVVNGDLNEEVHRDIDDFNRSNADSGQPERKVETFLKGELLRAFKDLGTDFWPTNLGDWKTYLELFLENGRGQLPKGKIATLFERSLPFETEKGDKPSANACARAAAGCAILCAAATSAFTLAQNHLAEFEAWTLFWAYTLGLAERWGLAVKDIEFALDLAQETMYSCLARLCDELMNRPNLVEGMVHIDAAVYRVRVTHLLGLLGIYGLWRRQRIQAGLEDEDRERTGFLTDFFKENAGKVWLWGEYAVPQFLAFNAYSPRAGSSFQEAEFRYLALIKAIAQRNGPGSERPLPNPYYEPEAILPHLLGLEEKPPVDAFAGYSYTLEGLLHLFARAGYKQHMTLTYPEVTRVGFRSFEPEEPWHFYRYRNGASGKDHLRYLQPPHSWARLREAAAEDTGAGIPPLLRRFPIQYLCFLCVMPHRVNASGLRWLDGQLGQ